MLSSMDHQAQSNGFPSCSHWGYCFTLRPCVTVSTLILKTILKGLSQSCVHSSPPKTFASIHLWALEKLPRKRLLKQNALFSMYLLAIGTGGMVLYTVKRLDADVNLSCFVWNLDATSLAPYQGRDQVSEAFYWLFTFLAVLLNCGFLHQIIQTRDDKHERESRVILATLQRILVQCSAARKIEFGRNCVENWKERVNLKERLNLKERVNLKRDVWWPCKWVAFHALNVVLHLLIIALLSIPGLMYIVQQSVGSYGVLKVFANATVVSISGSLLRISLYWVATKLATFQQMVYVNQKVQVDKIKFNRWRTKSMFIITWAMDVLVPIACIVVFDESCLRQYLKFSPSISGIMDYWAIGQTGFDAYRKGFCLQKLINVFSPVWCTTACISVFISPAQRMWLSSPAYHNATKWLNQWWQQKCSSEESKEIAAEEDTSEATGWQAAEDGTMYWNPAAFISGTDVDAKAESSSTALSPEPNALAMTAGNELQNESCSASQIGGSSTPAGKVVDAEMVKESKNRRRAASSKHALRSKA